MTGNPYTRVMQNVTAMPSIDPVRQARAQFVADAIDSEERSIRYMAAKVGINHTSLADRLKGKVAFHAEDLEAIARVLKRDPVAFYAEYISVGSAGFEPTTSTVESRQLAVVLPFKTRTA